MTWDKQSERCFRNQITCLRVFAALERIDARFFALVREVNMSGIAATTNAETAPKFWADAMNLKSYRKPDVYAAKVASWKAHSDDAVHNQIEMVGSSYPGMF